MKGVAGNDIDKHSDTLGMDDISTKRRWTATKVAGAHEEYNGHSGHGMSSRAKDTIRSLLRVPTNTMSLARRRKLTVYLLVFLIMLFLSSILDVRRASWRHRRSTKLELLLPSSSASRSNLDSSSAEGGNDPLSQDDTPLLNAPKAENSLPHVQEGAGSSLDTHMENADHNSRVGEDHLSKNADEKLSNDTVSVNMHGSNDSEHAHVRVHANIPESSAHNLSTNGAHGHGSNSSAFNSNEIQSDVHEAVNHDSIASHDGRVMQGRNVASDRYLSDQELKDDVDQLIAHVDEENSKAAELGSAAQETSHQNSTAGFAGGAIPNQSPGQNSISSGQGKGATTAERIKDFASNVFGLNDAKSANSTLEIESQKSYNSNGNDHGLSMSSTVSANDGANGSRHDVGPVADVRNSRDTGQSEIRLSAEELFYAAQKRLDAIVNNDKDRSFVDENELRLIQALGLQATRGNCEQLASSERGLLFKSDAEAAFNIDIERSDPLWGAWCIYMGTYKSDAMRDFVFKLKLLEANVFRARQEEEAGLANNNEASQNGTSFDAYATNLDDVMDEASQTRITGKLHYLRPHLQSNELRYIGALSLQASFGDCGPYGKEASGTRSSLIAPKLAAASQTLRPLTEPLTGQTANRRDGALWGAWCALQGKDRLAAANELTDRTDLLLGQLARSQATSASNSRQDGENAPGVLRVAVSDRALTAREAK